ncbi:hypothetical protein S245_063659 [Arachis hypogaea]
MTQNKSSIRISSSLFIEQTLITVVTLNSQLSSPWQPWKRADPRCAISLVSSSSLVSSLAPISSASSCHHALTLTIAFLSHRAATSPPPRLHRASATSLVRVCLDFPCWCVRLCFAQFSLLVRSSLLGIPFQSLSLSRSTRSQPLQSQDIRCQIMPAARAFPLQKLMASLQEY